MKQLVLVLIAAIAGSFSLLAQQASVTGDLPSAQPVTGDSLRAQALRTEKKAVSATSQDYGFKDLFVGNAMPVAGLAAPRLNPRAVSFVEDYIDRNSKDLFQLKEWGLPFFNLIDGIMVQNGLPRELKYLAIIESRLNAGSVSWAGAVGPWQFMPATGIRMGLKVNRSVDERVDYVKSTNAAAKYLKELYKEFGDWLLVIAAYNTGPGNVQKAIRKSGSRNFWDLQYHLPSESRNHVKKFIGTHYIFEGQGGMTTLTKAEASAFYGQNGVYNINRKLEPEELKNAKAQKISGKYQSVIIAKNLMMDMAEFNRYNPEFDKVMASNKNSYELNLPADKMELFNSNRYQILNESIQMMVANASMMKQVSAMQSKSVSPKKQIKR
ncbi:MAG: lytic transglycosylase domain-containing protein [Chitinophagaceae bacterium]|nr:lytic transglycosylase domain-containing protein [Chitinophagaceae bacterium]